MYRTSPGAFVTRRAVYAGSFDPITMGHIDIVRRGCTLFDEVIIAVGHNQRKKSLLPLDERLAIIRASTATLSNVVVESFEGVAGRALPAAQCMRDPAWVARGHRL